MLKHATPDCCRDHACDGCPTCAKGRCCRLDNPVYALPKLLEWDGDLVGEPGVLATDPTGDLVQCMFCGTWKRKLGLHLWFEHNVTSSEARAIWGLRRSTGLAAPTYKDAVRAANSERLARVRPRPGYVESLTPEQRTALKEHTSLPLETLLDPAYRAAMKRVGEKTTARARLYPCGCGCGATLPPGNGPRRGQRYLRGHAPPALADRVEDHLRRAGAPRRRADIAAALGAESSQVGRALGQLVRRKRIAPAARGLYAPARREEEGP